MYLLIEFVFFFVCTVHNRDLHVLTPSFPTRRSSDLQGDLAAGLEQPDTTSYIFRLRPEALWHNIAPVNGRPVTAEDVIFSYQRILDLKVFSSFIAGIEDRKSTRLNSSN